MRIIKFNKDYYVKSGDIIVNKEGKRFLVGDINELGGACDACDDCADVGYEEEVTLLGNVFKNPELLTK